MSRTQKFLSVFLFTILAQAAFASTDTRIISSEPKEIYGGTKENIQIRIGNGGAGPTGILRALAEDYLRESGKKYSIAWYQDISINTLSLLKKGTIDIALVYEKSQANAAQKEGWATHYSPIFNDHFLIVGPKKNPAKLSNSDSIQEIFLKISNLGEEKSAPTFLSRDDNSGTNVKERIIWEAVSLRPWKVDQKGGSKWYFKYHAFPQDALLYSNKNLLYSITDWGTWLSNKEQASDLEIFSQGGKGLLNHCFALLGNKPTKESLAFLDYLKSERAQNLIAEFGKDKYNGLALFTPAHQLDF